MERKISGYFSVSFHFFSYFTSDNASNKRDTKFFFLIY